MVGGDKTRPAGLRGATFAGRSRIVSWLVAAVVASLLGGCDAPIVADCGDDDDCPDGERCRGQACEPEVQCARDAECGEGRVCDDGACVASPSCSEPNDCPDGLICDEEMGACVSEMDECEQDWECEGEAICDDGACAAPPPSTDLRVTDFSVEVSGGDVVFEATAVNAGDTDTHDVEVHFYSHRSEAPVPDDLGDAVAEIESLSAGAQAPVQATLSGADPGSFDAWAQIDPRARIDDGDRAGNVAGPEPYTLSAAPDLAVETFHATPQSDGTVALEVTVVNRGSGDAPGFDIDFF